MSSARVAFWIVNKMAVAENKVSAFSSAVFKTGFVLIKTFKVSSVNGIVALINVPFDRDSFLNFLLSLE